MKTMDDCGRKYHPGKEDIKGKRNEKRAPGELTLLRPGHPFSRERSYDLILNQT